MPSADKISADKRVRCLSYPKSRLFFRVCFCVRSPKISCPSPSISAETENVYTQNALSINFLCQAKKMSPRTEMNPLLDFSPTSISENHFSLEIILRRHSSKIFSRIRRIQLFGIIYIFDEDSNYRAGMNEHASRSRTRT